jgi:hypothetical protein
LCCAAYRGSKWGAQDCATDADRTPMGRSRGHRARLASGIGTTVSEVVACVWIRANLESRTCGATGPLPARAEMINVAGRTYPCPRHRREFGNPQASTGPPIRPRVCAQPECHTADAGGSPAA